MVGMKAAPQKGQRQAPGGGTVPPCPGSTACLDSGIMLGHAQGNAYEDVLARLQVTRRHGDKAEARCPAHEDREASLSIKRADDGTVLLKCFAGCSVQEIVRAVGMSMADLFSKNGRVGGRGGSIPGRNSATVQPSSRPQAGKGEVKTSECVQMAAQPGADGLTVAQYAEAKGLSPEFLGSQGLTDLHYIGRPAVRIPYYDQGGAEVAVRFRLALTKSEGGNNRFRWRKGSKPKPYGLWRLDQARKAGEVAIVEGESDCHTLWSHKVAAMGIPGADTWSEEWACHLEGIDRLYVVVEPDAGGRAVRRWLAQSSIRDRVWLVDLGVHKDPSGMYLADRAGFPDAWNRARESAVRWQDDQRSAEQLVIAGAWDRCQALAKEPRILDKVAEAVAAAGLAGEERLVKLVYLVLVTRLLARPVSMALKGPSSAGKSYLLETVLAQFPPEAYYALSAMSERALAYSQEPLEHRFLVVYEAAGLQGDLASYLVRSLLSEGCVRYETVEKTSEGLKPRLIERQGPTGLVLTTTAVHLHPENETRLLSVQVSDSPEQTRQVLLALAADDERAKPDQEEWHALQAWLGGAEHRVCVSYAMVLAKAVPPVAVRLRRDFGALLNLIRAHAILHQASRNKDDQGRIVASLDDYAVVRELVADLVAEGVESSVPETVRKTVDAVSEILGGGPTETNLTAVAVKLGVDKSTALRRVRVAIDRGFLRNLEDRKGRPARIVLGEPLSKDAQILPTVEKVEAGLRGCTVAVGDSSPSPAPQNAQQEEEYEGWKP